MTKNLHQKRFISSAAEVCFLQKSLRALGKGRKYVARPILYNFLWSYFTNGLNKPECFYMAIYSSLVLGFRVRPGAYPRVGSTFLG
jgi:hypothetical protein